MWIGVIRILTQTNICSKSRRTSTAALSGMTDAWPAVTLLFCCLHLISELFCNPSNRQKWLCRSVVGCDFFFFFIPRPLNCFKCVRRLQQLCGTMKWNEMAMKSDHTTSCFCWHIDVLQHEQGYLQTPPVSMWTAWVWLSLKKQFFQQITSVFPDIWCHFRKMISSFHLKRYALTISSKFPTQVKCSPITGHSHLLMSVRSVQSCLHFLRAKISLHDYKSHLKKSQ